MRLAGLGWSYRRVSIRGSTSYSERSKVPNLRKLDAAASGSPVTSSPNRSAWCSSRRLKVAIAGVTSRIYRLSRRRRRGREAGAGHRQDLVPKRGVMERLESIEERRDEDRGDRQHQDDEQDRERRARHPPEARQPAKDRIQRREEQRMQQHPDQQPLPLISQPGAEALVREAIPLLADEARVDRQRESAQEGGERIEGRIHRDFQVGAPRHALREPLHPDAEAAADEERQQEKPPDRADRVEDISAVRIGFHARVVRRDRTERVLRHLRRDRFGRGGGPTPRSAPLRDPRGRGPRARRGAVPPRPRPGPPPRGPPRDPGPRPPPPK